MPGRARRDGGRARRRRDRRNLTPAAVPPSTDGPGVFVDFPTPQSRGSPNPMVRRLPSRPHPQSFLCAPCGRRVAGPCQAKGLDRLPRAVRLSPSPPGGSCRGEGTGPGGIPVADSLPVAGFGCGSLDMERAMGTERLAELPDHDGSPVADDRPRVEARVFPPEMVSRKADNAFVTTLRSRFWRSPSVSGPETRHAL